MAVQGASAVLSQGGKTVLQARQLQQACKPFAAARLPRRAVRPLHVRANWGAPVDFSNAKVVDSRQEAELLQRIRLDLGGLASSYTQAGQYIQAKTTPEAKAGFFAIASPPEKENGVVELLIKAAGETAEQVVASPAGSDLLVSAPMGKGFPVDKIPAAEFPNVLLFATGSGISPIRALIESGALGKRKSVKLYYGVRTRGHLAFKDSFPAWEAAGVQVVTVFSQEGQGYVQEAFAKEAAAVSDWSGTAVVLCGHKQMAEAIKELVEPKGVPVLLNF